MPIAWALLTSVLVDLFHTGVGATRDDRYIVVSIYSDGFSYVPDLNPPPADVPVRSCQPWYYRTDHPTDDFVEAATNTNKERINELIDQPGRCLRDDIDSLDLIETKDSNLSTIPPPMALDKNWVLVDSAEAMKAAAEELLVSPYLVWSSPHDG